jgi:hypothetical protein
MYGYALVESHQGGMVESESFNATPRLRIISNFFLNAVGNRGCRWHRPHPFHAASVHDDGHVVPHIVLSAIGLLLLKVQPPAS